MKETAKESHGKGLAPGKSTMATSDIPGGFDYKQPMETKSLEDFNCRVGPSGEASADLSTSVALAQNVNASKLVVLPSTLILAPPLKVDPLCSSTGQLVKTPEEEYAAFRDIGTIKKRHIPLLEQAMANYPSLWTWREKFKGPQFKQFGYTILGDMLDFLASTKWRDLTDGKKAEFESLVNEMEAFGFDIQWLANTHAKIKQSKFNEDTINCKKTLEEQLVAEQNKVEDMEVHLQMSKAKLQKIKVELDDIEAELGSYNDLIGF